jgi:hypothetical protein
MKNELQIVTYKQAIALKKLGFNWETPYFHPNTALALKWFRDEKGIFGIVDMNGSGKFFYCAVDEYAFDLVLEKKYEEMNYDTYEAAESALLTELINLIDKQN